MNSTIIITGLTILAISYLIYRGYKAIIECLEEDRPDYMSDEDKDELEGLW